MFFTQRTCIWFFSGMNTNVAVEIPFIIKSFVAIITFESFQTEVTLLVRILYGKTLCYILHIYTVFHRCERSYALSKARYIWTTIYILHRSMDFLRSEFSCGYSGLFPPVNFFLHTRHVNSFLPVQWTRLWICRSCFVVNSPSHSSQLNDFSSNSFIILDCRFFQEFQNEINFTMW